MGISSDVDLTGKTVLVNADSMAEEYRTTEFRLFRVVGGFGAKPHSASRTLLGDFLFDGEPDRLDRGEVEAVVEPHDDAGHPDDTPTETCPACALARLTASP
jgi:hypothetical protein